VIHGLFGAAGAELESDEHMMSSVVRLIGLESTQLGAGVDAIVWVLP